MRVGNGSKFKLKAPVKGASNVISSCGIKTLNIGSLVSVACAMAESRGRDQTARQFLD